MLEKRIYFIGINGIGMSGLAKIMKTKGYDVIGADLSRTSVTEELESIGITIYAEHDIKNLKNVDLVIVSSAIKEGNPEYMYALENKIKVLKRGEYLAELLNLSTGIAVAGTHGKTTTSSMLGTTMLTLDPTIVVGGILPEIASNARCGTSEFFIAEADESDNSFLYMNPEYSIITNIEADHLENHGSLEKIEKSFIQFMEQTQKEIIVCNDCKNIRRIIKNRKNIKTYSLHDETSDIYAKNIEIKNGITHFDVLIQGEFQGNFSLGIPGDHNINNALPVIYLSKKFGVSLEEIQKKLLNFKGAKRRYDILYDEKCKVIDDYAHHPTEIKATIQGALTIETKPIVAIFQPHRYSRINFLIEEFKDIFQGVEKVILLPIYSAGEKNIYNITLETLKEKINHNNTVILENNELLDGEIEFENEEKIYLFMGAGDISKIAHKIVIEKK